MFIVQSLTDHTFISLPEPVNGVSVYANTLYIRHAHVFGGRTEAIAAADEVFTADGHQFEVVQLRFSALSL